MNAAESMATLHEILEKYLGPDEAKKSVTAIVYNVFNQLQEEGLPVTEQTITEHLAKYAEEYLKAARNGRDLRS